MMPGYVEYGARVTAPPPFICREGQFQALVFEGTDAALSALCEKMLNVPAAGGALYSPIGRHVLVLTGSFAKVASQAPGFSERGSVRETQLSIWVPARASYPQRDPADRESLCMLVPYIFVDNPMSYLGGREDFGYAKAMGQFQPPSALGTRITLDAFGGDFATGNQASWLPLLEIEDPQAAAGSHAALVASEEWKSGSELAALLGGGADPSDTAGAIASLGLLRDLLEGLFQGRTRQVFLKQFRDGGAAEQACYQALVEAPAQVENVRWRPSLREWKLTVNPLDSHPIAADLGLESQATRLSFDVAFDMTVATGTIVAPPSMI
jgi:hypothetical protein